MTTLNSKILLVKDINMDKDYKNVIDYSESNLLSLCNSSNHLVDSKDHYSFIRPGDNRIITDFSYSDCLKANYIAFQNPNYDNKWFFAFITDVKYESEKATTIEFKVDSWSTWFKNITVKSCFVIREHVNSDIVGEHTLPENLESGTYIVNSTSRDLLPNGNNTYIVISTTYVPSEISPRPVGASYNGVFSGTYNLAFNRALMANNFLKKMDALSKADAVVSVYLAPTSLIPDAEFTEYSIPTSDFPSLVTELYKIPSSNTSVEMNRLSYNITAPSSIDGYTPKNKKLLTYPYCYMYVTNNAGSDVEYHYEDFAGGANFRVEGSLTPGCSIRVIPLNYKQNADSVLLNTTKSYSYGITGAKYPVCSWNTDTYTNWLTSNSVNIGISTAGAYASIIGGAALIATGVGTAAGIGAIMGGAGALASSASQYYQHALVPPQARGNTNAGDVCYSLGKMTIPCYDMSIKSEYAHIIDNYFTRFGYKVNALKTPNITGRPYWNYIEIASSEDIGNGSIPNIYKEEINQICRNGVTIWHNHDNIGNYNLDNSL